MPAEFKQLLLQGQKNFNNVTLNLSSATELTELNDLLSKEAVSIKTLELLFTKMPITERSSLINTLNPLLNHIQGLNTLKLDAALKNYALGEFLKNDTVLHLTELELVVGVADPDLAGQQSHFESEVVAYLNANKGLKSLTLQDNEGSITAHQFPKLKLAICKHPRLMHFHQGFADASSHAVLAKDPAVILNLAKNVAIDPQIKRASFEKIGDRVFQKMLSQLEQLKNDWDLRQKHTHWLASSCLLDSFHNELITLNSMIYDLGQDAAATDHYKDRIQILSSYVLLMKHTVMIYLRVQQVPDWAAYQSKVEQFWDTTRISLFAEIKTCDKPAAVLSKIHTADAQMKAILKIVHPHRFPSSYEVLTKGSLPLFQAEALLRDYTKDNSAISRFFHGHWNRHHITEVNNIVMRINCSGNDAINSIDDLLVELHAIKLKNPIGSLAKRIAFIEETFGYAQGPVINTGLKL